MIITDGDFSAMDLDETTEVIRELNSKSAPLSFIDSINTGGSSDYNRRGICRSTNYPFMKYMAACTGGVVSLAVRIHILYSPITS